MRDGQAHFTGRRLTTPRAAAVAGILFALLYGTSLVLVRISIPDVRSVDAAWMQTHAQTVTLALNLVPYAGIAFLWFIGVIRDRVGALEDRFFATVFLGQRPALPGADLRGRGDGGRSPGELCPRPGQSSSPAMCTPTAARSRTT